MHPILARWLAAFIFALLTLVLAPDTDGLLRSRGGAAFAIIILTVLFAVLLDALRVAWR